MRLAEPLAKVVNDEVNARSPNGLPNVGGARAERRRRRSESPALSRIWPANVWDFRQSGATRDDAELASELRASAVTTQPMETVIAVLAERRDGAMINAAPKASGVNYSTAQRISVATS